MQLKIRNATRNNRRTWAEFSSCTNQCSIVTNSLDFRVPFENQSFSVRFVFCSTPVWVWDGFGETAYLFRSLLLTPDICTCAEFVLDYACYLHCVNNKSFTAVKYSCKKAHSTVLLFSQCLFSLSYTFQIFVQEKWKWECKYIQHCPNILSPLRVYYIFSTFVFSADKIGEEKEIGVIYVRICG